MENYTIRRNVIGSRKSRNTEYSYSIIKDGKCLCDGIAKVTFTSKKKAETFADNFNEETALENGYRWFKIL